MGRAILLASAIYAASLAGAATVGNLRIDGGADTHRPISILTFSSVQNAVQAISDGLSGIGQEQNQETAKAIVSWLTMLPTFDFADPRREATAILITPEADQETPGQVAVIPLKPLNGEDVLRKMLAANYATTSGSSVIFCSDAKNDDVPPILALIIMRDTVFIASDRESLRWIARRWKEGELPTVPPLRDGAAISATFDGRLAGATIASIVPDDAATADGQILRFIAWFRDLLYGIDSLHASLDADLRSWHISARLTPRDDSAKSLFDAKKPDGKTLDPIPRDAYCVSSGLFRQFASLLPPSLVARYSGTSAFSFFGGFQIFPGSALETLSRELAPFLAGESSSAYVISRGDGITARVRTFALSDPKGASAAMEAFFSRDFAKEVGTMRKPRVVDGHRIYSCTATRKPSDEVSDDYVASAIVLLTEMNCIEATVSGDQLIVVSGPYGTIGKILAPGALPAKARAIDSLAPSLGTLPEGETLLGCGELQPSRTFQALAQSKPGLEELARHLPRHGGGIAWRISEKDGDVIFETSLTTSELFAIAILRKFDQKQLGHILLDDMIMNKEKSSQ